MAAILKSNMADIERNPSGPISKNVRNMLMYMCAKFGACITKCTLLLNIWAKLPHYEEFTSDHDRNVDDAMIEFGVFNSECSELHT